MQNWVRKGGLIYRFTVVQHVYKTRGRSHEHTHTHTHTNTHTHTHTHTHRKREWMNEWMSTLFYDGNGLDTGSSYMQLSPVRNSNCIRERERRRRRNETNCRTKQTRTIYLLHDTVPDHWPTPQSPVRAANLKGRINRSFELIVICIREIFIVL